MKIYHYSVFAASPGGGKQFAIVEGVDDPVDMQRIAASSGQPLTGFILNADSSTAEVRFFSPTKEKGSSDSGALVVGEHLRRAGVIGDRLVVNAGGEELEVFARGGNWWSNQGSTFQRPFDFAADALLEALGLDEIDLEQVVLAGSTRLNIVVPIAFHNDQLEEDTILDSISPDFGAIAKINQESKTNGVIVCSGLEPIAGEWVTRLRFFAPAKGIPEDNAGSFTVASLCGYFAGKGYQGRQQITFFQGSGKGGKFSRLYSQFEADDHVAKKNQVGGKVELLEVTTWA
ncbi:MAG: PhzF family phenazine biosynthesis protein [Meiothermus sp.]|nr:PhzF family phenazine biosynthesis protein [Meiothermus sp.]